MNAFIRCEMAFAAAAVAREHCPDKSGSPGSGLGESTGILLVIEVATAAKPFRLTDYQSQLNAIFDFNQDSRRF